MEKKVKGAAAPQSKSMQIFPNEKHYSTAGTNNTLLCAAYSQLTKAGIEVDANDPSASLRDPVIGPAIKQYFLTGVARPAFDKDGDAILDSGSGRQYVWLYPKKAFKGDAVTFTVNDNEINVATEQADLYADATEVDLGLSF